MERYDSDGLLEVIGDLRKQVADLTAQLEAARGERDHAKKMEQMQKEVADNQAWWVQKHRAEVDNLNRQLNELSTVANQRFDHITVLQAELTTLRQELKEAQGNYDRACMTVASMHAAATGIVGEGPRRGVVEDVADMRAELTTLRQERDDSQTILETMMVSLEEAGFKQPTHTLQLKAALAELQTLRAALESIAKNTCCGPCQEAALVAQHALATRQVTPEEGA